MTESSILTEARAGYRVITLNRPERLNAFNDAMHEALRDAIAQAEADESCRALLITGAGRGFCAGQDLSDRLLKPGEKPVPRNSLETYYNPLVRKLRALPFPVIAAVNGVAAGAGCNIALACDIVLAARSASFTQSFARIGLIPDSGGTWLLPRLVGEARARALALLAEPLPAEKAEQLGPDLEMRRRRRARRRSTQIVRAFRRRPDAGPGADQARARCIGRQLVRRPARSRTRSAARGQHDARLCRRRARLHGKAQTEFQRPEILMTLATRLTRRFDIQHPILCAPMGMITGGKLAGAVSSAGGLGILGGGYAGTVGNEPDLDEQYRAAGNVPIGIGFITWAAQKAPQMVDWAIARKPACLFLSFGDPAPFARKAHDAGIAVVCQTQTMRHVREALDAGAMAIVAQGAEAGGHGGRRATMPFVPEVKDYLAKHAPDVLLIAAGGIADGRGLAASLMLGADGVLVGTRFWAAEEALTAPAMVARAVAADGDQTVRTAAVDHLRGVPWPDEFSFRVMRNAVTDQWAEREHETRLKPGAMKAQYIDARARGDLEVLPTVAGEAIGMIGARLPAAEIVAAMVREAEAALKAGAALMR